ncbi:FAD/NAD(P)-binding domain-containing protein [Panus rudis PR-1116 ss-1]|nr:FAD/NAD(P)-binding domain-containing protein [Panus rudis PR-1116 ss-1]
MSNSARKDFEVIIVGGGIVGLICAVALQNEGVPVQIYEAAESFTEIGAAVAFAPHALEILRRLDLLDDIFPGSAKQALSAIPIWKRADKENEVLLEISDDDLRNGLSWQRPAVHRAKLLDALSKHIDSAIVHFKKRCKSVSSSPEGRPVVLFEDGSSLETDVLIGADGIRSKIRSFVTGSEDSRVAFSNTTSYRALVPTKELRAAGVKLDIDKRGHIMVGKGKHLFLVPIQEGQLVNVGVAVTDRSIPFSGSTALAGKWSIDASREEVLAHFSDYDPESEIVKMLRCISKAMKLPIHVVYPPLESYAMGRVALIGDAAHAMQPFLASGAGMGTEDAYLLSRVLGHPKINRSNIESALQLYSRLRVPRVREVWKASQMSCDILQGYGPLVDTPEGIRKDIRDLLVADSQRYAQEVDKDVGVAEAFGVLETIV